MTGEADEPVFIGEPDPAGDNGWRVVCCFGADLFLMGSGFANAAGARAWARYLNGVVERILQAEASFDDELQPF